MIDGLQLVCHVAEAQSLLQQLFEQSFFAASERPYFNRAGGVSSWALDLRVTLTRSEYLRPVAAQMLRVLQEHNVRQIVGKGYGALILVGGIIASGTEIQGAMIRADVKKYGFRQALEGGLDKDAPVFIVDDVLSSGRTVVAVAESLLSEGYHPTGV
jgi:orotate phosphoribosyltransferase